MQAIGQNGGFPFSASNSGEANSRNFPGQVEYFFLRLEPRFCCRFIILRKLCNFALKAFTLKVDLLKIKRVLGAAFY